VHEIERRRLSPEARQDRVNLTAVMRLVIEDVQQRRCERLLGLLRGRGAAIAKPQRKRRIVQAVYIG
jgi:hypothetical protein